MAARPPNRGQLNDLMCVHPNAAGLDIGSEEIIAAVPADHDPHPVRAFRTFTPDLHALVDWLRTCKIDTVAMESTGVFWIPIYELLEQHGITPYLVNAQHVKTVPGRKSDWNDAQWLQKLHRFGLVHGSFRPDAEICKLRTLVRHRAQLIEHRAPHILHIQQALKQMNIQLSVVLRDIMGTTGQAILRAIVAGERDPVQLARHRHPACHSSEDLIARALTGTWQAEYLFVLTQALALYDFYTEQIALCDRQIEVTLRAMEPRYDGPPTASSPSPTTSKTHARNRPSFDARTQFVRIVGVDLVAITGLGATTIQAILAEVGTDMMRFPSSKHFCSWLGLAPHNDISGGKVLRSHTRKVVNRAGQAFRQAAQAVARSDSAFGAYYRSMRARLGPQQAIVATAHKIARVFYHVLKYREAFKPESIERYEQQRRERELKHLMRRATKLGYELMPAMTLAATGEPALVNGGVA